MIPKHQRRPQSLPISDFEISFPELFCQQDLCMEIREWTLSKDVPQNTSPQIRHEHDSAVIGQDTYLTFGLCFRLRQDTYDIWTVQRPAGHWSETGSVPVPDFREEPNIGSPFPTSERRESQTARSRPDIPRAPSLILEPDLRNDIRLLGLDGPPSLEGGGFARDCSMSLEWTRIAIPPGEN